MHRIAAIAIALASVTCQRDNPYYCQGAPLDNCLAVDAPPTGCTGDPQCGGDTPVCDVAGSHTCVACSAAEPGACMGASPVCAADHTCVACVAHADCGSLACLPDGSCGTDSAVAYVDPGGTDNAQCTLATPCTRVAKALATHRPYVKLHGTTDEAVSIDSVAVTLLADPGAKLTRTQNGLLLEVKGSAHVEIYDLEITGASGPSGAGIVVQFSGTTFLGLYRVRVSHNQAGGVSINGGTFSIVGSVFVSNGSQDTSVGGLAISTSQNASNRLDFNSFNKNGAQDGLGAAIQCVAGVFTARDNILSDNGTFTNNEQLGGTCAYAYSIVRPGTLPPGTGNSQSDPLFVNTTTGDLHIQPTSPAIGAADANADLSGAAARDLDGDLRVAPADIGADQHH